MQERHKKPVVLLGLDTSRAADREMLNGFVKYANLKKSFELIWQQPSYYAIDYSLDKLKSFAKIAKSTGASGFFGWFPKDSEKEIQEMTELGIKSVVIPLEKQIPGVHNVTEDSSEIARRVVQHFVECGVKHFAYYGVSHFIWSNWRKQAFAHNVERLGFQPHILEIPKITNRIKRKKVNDKIATWLESLPKPAGLMACNDDLALHLVQICRQNDIDIPQEIAIVGVDNDELLCNLAHSHISSVALTCKYCGYRAAEMIDRLLNRQDTDDIELSLRSTRIIKRQSSNILAIKDSNVVNAVRFIQNHTNDRTQVQQVAEAVYMSTRTLERKFSKNLGTSVSSFIRKNRIERIESMLALTNMSVKEIATELGYKSIPNMSRFFKKETGMTCGSYREQFGK